MGKLSPAGPARTPIDGRTAARPARHAWRSQIRGGAGNRGGADPHPMAFCCGQSGRANEEQSLVSGGLPGWIWQIAASVFAPGRNQVPDEEEAVPEGVRTFLIVGMLA